MKPERIGRQVRRSSGAILIGAIALSGCIAVAPPPSGSPSPRRSSQEASVYRGASRASSYDSERLRQVMLPLLQAMDRPCNASQIRVGIINENDINAANAGNCEFLFTTGLLRRASDDQLRGVLAHEIAHQDLGHVAKAQALGAGLNVGVAVLQQFFPVAGALAPVAGTLIARGYGRTEEYAADRHGIEILRRAGYPKDVLLDTLAWIRRTSGDNGGGFLSTHPAIDDRIAALQRAR